MIDINTVMPVGHKEIVQENSHLGVHSSSFFKFGAINYDSKKCVVISVHPTHGDSAISFLLKSGDKYFNQVDICNTGGEIFTKIKNLYVGHMPEELALTEYLVALRGSNSSVRMSFLEAFGFEPEDL